ncbi:thiol-specific monooxygenase [Stachybotrys elegans]|uniref:Thiol-specific monooxygenase n=1 Tax=Stachybotrys elegans TaxID=80388 RepID=A0A8K0WXD4_9HYPO|nr:thiol-specific monooxygenase [Stachybotrys elegans]
MAKAARRVAVIGAGPAGAIVTDALVKEQAFDKIRVFERRHTPGGTWLVSDYQVLTPGDNGSRRIPFLRALLDKLADQPAKLPSKFPCQTQKVDEVNSEQLRYSDTAAHEYLHSNLPPNIMAFTQEPIPKIEPRGVLPQYGPIPVFRHREVIRQWVHDIFKRSRSDSLIEFNTTVESAVKKGDEWVVTLRKDVPGDSNNSWWQETFDALVVASGHYSLPFVPSIPGLAEYETKFPGRIEHTKHYHTAEKYTGKRVIVVGGSVSAFDALHDIRQTAALPLISSVREPSGVFGWAPFKHPDFDNRPPISSLDPETGRITFTDGSVVDDVDHVLFATGYDFTFPFLPHIKPKNGRIPGLYQHVFQTSDPSLAFIGMVTGGFGLRIFEWQAVTAARVLAGRSSLPSRQEMEEWERERLSTKGDGPPFWTLMPDFETHFEAYRKIAGEPEPGTTGRVLPKYDEKWAEEFWKLIDARIQWWSQQAAAVGSKVATDKT